MVDMMSEFSREKRSSFVKSMIITLIIGNMAIAGVLLVGIIGYMHYADLTLADSFVNAANIISGMGPTSHMISDESKVFEGCYAIFCGIYFLVIVTLIFSPVVHYWVSMMKHLAVIEAKDKLDEHVK